MPVKADLQHLRALREKKHREALGLFVVEGEKVVAELLTAKFPFVEIYATNEWPGWTSAPVPAPIVAPTRVVLVTPEEMARASHFPTPSSVLAVGKLERRTLGPSELDHGLTLALDGVQDAGNVGTLLRIADWYALDRVLLSPDCADLFSQKVINASMGSFARMPTYTVDLAAALADRAAGVATLGCDLTGDSVHSLPSLPNAVIVIGSEGRGLSPAVAATITHRVTIPKFGGAESLNAAVAAAIVCDNLRRRSG